MKVRFLLLALLMGSMLNAQPGIQKDISTMIEPLTLDEKISLIVGAGYSFPGAEKDDKVPGAAGESVPIPRIGLPTVVFADGPAGIRINPERQDRPGETFYATGFPIASLLASSWDRELLTEVGAAFGAEAKAYGVDFLLAPGMNIHRNPLGGRNFEYYSEDPFLSGHTAAAFVRGVQSEGVGATIKHLAANNQETNRTDVNTIVSQRALREIYLRGFEIAVRESKPWSIMTAYNLINGVPASESKGLLTDILRGDWGYEGFVMTDWFAGEDAVAQVRAGNDLLMPGTKIQADAIREAVREGRLSEAAIDRNLARILEAYQKTLAFKNYEYNDKPNLAAHAQVAREAAAEGMVLLKNEAQSLPLDPTNDRIALFGVSSYETIAGGTGSGDVNKPYVVSIAAGLAEAGYALNEQLTGIYDAYLAEEKLRLTPKTFPFEPDHLVPEQTWLRQELENAADNSDVAVVTLGRTSGEFEDRRLEGDFRLTAAEQDLLRQLSEVYHERGKKVVVLLNIGGVIETASWRDRADAILLVWQPGQEAGHAVADVVSGEKAPSGKLPVTFPLRYDDLPSAASFPGKEVEKERTTGGWRPPFFGGKPAEVVYDEGIYVGYRYFTTFDRAVAYSFGHGLSYTTFEYDDLSLDRVGEDEWAVALEVTNTGNYPGREVIQLYLSAPQENLEKPERELRAFLKTKELQPGESQQLTFTLRAADLASFHPKRSAWIAGAGRYRILLGSSSTDIRLMGSFQLTEEQVVQQVEDALAPEVPVRELKQDRAGYDQF